MTTVALLGVDLVLSLVTAALWAYAAVRAAHAPHGSPVRWAVAGTAVLAVRAAAVVVLAGRGWELAAERVTVGVPLTLLAAAAALGLVARDRRHGCRRSTPAAVALWCAAAMSVVSLALTSVVGYPGGPGAATHDHHGAGAISVTELRTPRAPARATRAVELVAQTQSVRLPSGRVVEAWTFGSLPGPTLTARVGDTLDITLRNRDIAVGVTLHWHGLAVPNGEDGVAGVTQDAVLPGGSFLYRLRFEQPGTYWYHTHQRGGEGIARGLYGALVVRPAVAEPTEVAEQGLDLALPFHTLGQTSILAGSDQVERQVVPAGTPVRLRLLNTDQQPRRFALTGTAFRVVALDGVDLAGPTEVTDQDSGCRPVDGTTSRSRCLTRRSGSRSPALAVPDWCWPRPPTDPIRDPRSLTATFDPTTYGSAQGVPSMAGPYDVSATLVLDRLPRMVNGRPALAQTVNGGVYPNIPPVMVAEGDLVRMRVVNRSFETHPMHPHGHHVLVLSVNGRAPSGSPLWLDTFDVQPGEVWEVALRADNPGIWMDHCHNLEHAAAGMMFHLAYAGVSTPFRHGPGTVNTPE